MRIAALLLVLFASPATALTMYYNLEDWQAAVGAYQVEDFESYPEMRLPIRGGTVALDHFSIENDDQGDNDWSGLSGLWLGENWYDSGIPPGTDESHCQHRARCVSPRGRTTSTRSSRLRSWPTRWSTPGVRTSRNSARSAASSSTSPRRDSPWRGRRQPPLDSLLICNHSWCAVDAVLWAPVPEPSTGLLVGLGLLAVGSRRSRRR